MMKRMARTKTISRKKNPKKLMKMKTIRPLLDLVKKILKSMRSKSYAMNVCCCTIKRKKLVFI